MNLNDELTMPPAGTPASPDIVAPPPTPTSADELSKELTMPPTTHGYMVGANLKSADLNNTTPERATQVLELQKKTGLPINLVDSQLELVSKEAAKKDFNAQQFTQDHPEIAKWMAENPQQAALGRDDNVALSNIDNILRRYSPSTAAALNLLSRLDNSKPGDDTAWQVMQKATKQAGYSFLQSHGGLEQQAAITMEGRAFPITPQEALDHAREMGLIGKDEPVDMSQGLMDKPKIMDALIDSANDLERINKERIKASPLYKSGEERAAFGTAAMQEYAPKVQDAGLKYYLGQGTQAFFSSVLPLMGISMATGGTALTGLSAMGIQVYGQKLNESLQAGRSIREAQADAWFYTAAETIPEEIPLEYALHGVGTMFKKLLGTMWREGGQEMITEVLEAGYDAGVLNQDMTLGQAFRRVADAGIVGALMGVGMAGLGHAGSYPMQIINNRRNKLISQNNEKFFTALGDASKDSKLRESLPEHYQELLGQLTKNGPIETLYTPVEFFQSHFEAAGMDPRQVANDLGVGPQYDQALESGAKLAIPTAAYAAQIAPTEHNAAFVKELATSPEGMTSRELDDLHEQLKQEVQKTAQGTDFEQSLEKVRQDVYARLAATMTQSEANHQADLWRERLRSRAEILGLDPWELYQKHRLTVAREGIPSVQSVMEQKIQNGVSRETFPRGTTQFAQPAVKTTPEVTDVHKQMTELAPAMAALKQAPEIANSRIALEVAQQSQGKTTLTEAQVKALQTAAREQARHQRGIPTSPIEVYDKNDMLKLEAYPVLKSEVTAQDILNRTREKQWDVYLNHEEGGSTKIGEFNSEIEARVFTSLMSEKLGLGGVMQAKQEDIHRQTRDEFIGNAKDAEAERLGTIHRLAVKRAMNEKTMVPERVLKDYPDLIAKQARAKIEELQKNKTRESADAIRRIEAATPELRQFIQYPEKGETFARGMEAISDEAGKPFEGQPFPSVADLDEFAKWIVGNDYVNNPILRQFFTGPTARTHETTQLYGDDAHAVLTALAGLRDAGVPIQNLLYNVSGIVRYTQRHMGAHVAVLNEKNNDSYGSVLAFSFDILEGSGPENLNKNANPLQLKQLVSHELMHGVDHAGIGYVEGVGNENVGRDGYSAYSELFQIKVGSRNGVPVLMMGDVIREMYQAYTQDKLGLGTMLSYPFAKMGEMVHSETLDELRNMEVFFAQETFAQLGSLYYTIGTTTQGRDALTKIMPSAMRFMDEVHDAITRGDLSTDGARERDAGVRKAFQLTGSQLGKLAVSTRTAAQNAARVTQQGRTDTGIRQRPGKPEDHGRVEGFDPTKFKTFATGRIVGAKDMNISQIKKLYDQALVDLKSPNAVAETSKDWYKRSGDLIRRLTHGDEQLMERMVRLLALTSPQTNVFENLNYSIRAAYEIAKGNYTPGVGLYREKIDAVMKQNLDAKDFDRTLRMVGPKVESFYRNLHDEAFQRNEYPNTVTVDSWILRYFGYPDTAKSAQRGFISELIRQITDGYNQENQTDLKPRQVQAMLWTYALNESEGMAALERGRPFVPEDKSFKELSTSVVPTVMAETIPSTSTPYAGIADLTAKQKTAFTKDALKLIKDGKTDLLAEKIGIPLYAMDQSVGAYAGALNPNFVTEIAAIKINGGQVNTDMVKLYSLALQYLYMQDEVMFARPDDKLFGTPEGQQGLRMGFKDSLTPEKLQDIYQRVQKHLGENSGFTKVNNDLIFLNFGEDAAFFDKLHTLHDELARDYAIMAAVEFSSESYATPKADWKSDPEGKSLLREIQRLSASQAGRSDLSEWLSGRRDAYRQLAEKTLSGKIAPRGATSFAQQDRGVTRIATDKSINIELFKNADLSTFLHESGHAFLVQMHEDVQYLRQQGTPNEKQQKLIDDFGKLLKWMGISEREMRTMSPEAIAGNEKFARGFEAYLAEGKSPSIELRSAFQRFKAWLMHVYSLWKKNATISQSLDVHLNAEVRGIMDRLIATDDQINNAQKDSEIKPVFTTAADAGMSDAEFAAYQKTLEDANQNAQQELEQQALREFQREREKWWKEARDKMHAEIAADVDQRPIYKALAELKREGGPRLDRTIIKERFADRIRSLPRGITVEEGGIDPDTAAEMFGFKSGEELVNKLSTMMSRDKLINSETDFRMRQEHGDMMVDGTMVEKAKEAVRGEGRSKVILEELKALQKKARDVKPFVQAAQKTEQEKQKAGRQIYLAAIPSLAEARNTAETTIAATKLRDLKPMQYYAAARKAARAALTAYGNGDFVLAAVNKRQELISNEMFRSAAKAKNEIDKIVENQSKYDKKSVRERLAKYGADFLEQIDALRARYDFHPQSETVLAKKKASLREWYDSQVALGFEPTISPEMMDEAQRMNYRDMTLEELRGFDDALKSIAYIASRQNKIATMQAEKEYDGVVDEMTQRAEESLKKLSKKKERILENWLDRTKNKIIGHAVDLVPLETLIELLDNGAIGPWHDYLFNLASEAQTKYYDMQKDIGKKVGDIIDSYIKHGTKRMTDMFQTELQEEPMSRYKLISIAMNIGNESNFDKLVRGMKDQGWNEKKVLDAVKQLDKVDLEFTQKLWDTINTLYQPLNELQKRVSGVPLPKVDARPVHLTLKNGETVDLAGGYYPVKYDPALSLQGAKQDTGPIAGLTERGYARATAPDSFRKTRTKFAAPLLFDFNYVVQKHLSGVMKDLTHREFLIDMNRLFRDKRIRKVLQERLGTEYEKMFMPWLKGVANDGNFSAADMIGWDRIFEGLRSKVTVVALGFKVTSMMAQVSALSNSLEYIANTYGAGYLSSALGEFVKSPFEALKMTKEKSGEMRHRYETIDREMRDELTRISEAHKNQLLTHTTHAMEMVERAAFYGINFFDRMVSVPTWMAAYKGSMDQMMKESPTMDPKEMDAKAVHAGDAAVRRTQGTGGPKDLSTIQRKRGMMKLLTMFYTPFAGWYGRLHTVGAKMARSENRWRYTPEAVMAVMLVTAIPTIMSDLLAGRGPKDCKNKSGSDWASCFGRWMAIEAGFSMTAPFPVIRDIGNALQSYAIDGRPRDTRFSPVLDAVNRMQKVGRQASSVMFENKQFKSDLAFDIFEASGYFMGIPTAQPRITMQYLYDLLSDKESPDNPLEFMRNLAYRRSKK